LHETNPRLHETNPPHDGASTERHRAQVGHYWTVDPANAALTVLRWAPEAYLATLTAGRTDRVRAEPFEAVELFVGALFGDEE
jgi:hypothetical protein